MSSKEDKSNAVDVTGKSDGAEGQLVSTNKLCGNVGALSVSQERDKIGAFTAEESWSVTPCHAFRIELSISCR